MGSCPKFWSKNEKLEPTFKNMANLTLNDIHSVMTELATIRKAFWSEADFQFAFAWILKKQIPSAGIKLERVYIGPNDTYHVDIWVDLDNKVYTIELKYKTQKVNPPIIDFDGTEINLKDQAGGPGNRLLFLKDIQRNEIYASNITNFGGGFAIMLTNVPSYYKIPKNDAWEKCSDGLFRIHEGQIFNKSAITWKNKKGWQDDYHPFTLNGNYSMTWNDYKPSCIRDSIYKFKMGLDFKYVAVEIK